MISTRLFHFETGRLQTLARSRAAEYQKAQPFPHILIDNFLPEEVAEEILQEFPKPDQIRWLDKTHEHSKKLACNDLDQMGDFTRHMFSEFNASAFVKFLETLTGIKGLVPDPHLIGGGLHQIERGGKLDIHADFNLHDHLRVDRRLNALVYLNKDWREEYGGHFELWDRNMTRSLKKVLPVFNRLVVFSTSDYSYHGHPDPLNCPEDRTRKSLALYYYTNGRPAHEVSGSHDTLYQQRPGEEKQRSLRDVAKKFVPPIVTEALRKAKGK